MCQKRENGNEKIISAMVFVAIAMVTGCIVSIYRTDRDLVEAKNAAPAEIDVQAENENAVQAEITDTVQAENENTAQAEITDTVRAEDENAAQAEIKSAVQTDEMTFSCEVSGCTQTEVHHHGLCGIDGCTQIGEHSHGGNSGGHHQSGHGGGHH